jgi:hypothetical protein
MRSSYDSYHTSSSTSNALRNPRYTSPSNYLDLNPTTGGSERAEFRDRYQNRVKKKQRFFCIN